MSDTLVLAESDYMPIPDGEILPAIVEKVEKRQTPFDVDRDDPSKGKRWEVSFTFIIDEGNDFEGRKVFGNTPTTFTTHPDCKLRRWLQELLNIEGDMGAGHEVNLSDFVGVSCRVQVAAKKRDDGTTKNYVAEVVRPGVTAPRPAAETAAAAPAASPNAPEGVRPGEEPF